jgi:hypothetical protein
MSSNQSVNTTRSSEGAPDNISRNHLRLWEPQFTIYWSILFGALFGSILQYSNWLKLADDDRKTSNLGWALIAFLWVLIIVFVSAIPFILKSAGHIAILIAWYIHVGNSQEQYIQSEGIEYSKQSFIKPVLCYLAFVVVIVGSAQILHQVGVISLTTSETKKASTPDGQNESFAPPSGPVSQSHKERLLNSIKEEFKAKKALENVELVKITHNASSPPEGNGTLYYRIKDNDYSIPFKIGDPSIIQWQISPENMGAIIKNVYREFPVLEITTDESVLLEVLLNRAWENSTSWEATDSSPYLLKWFTKGAERLSRHKFSANNAREKARKIEDAYKVMIQCIEAEPELEQRRYVNAVKHVVGGLQELGDNATFMDGYNLGLNAFDSGNMDDASQAIVNLRTKAREQLDQISFNLVQDVLNKATIAGNQYLMLDHNFSYDFNEWWLPSGYDILNIRNDSGINLNDVVMIVSFEQPNGKFILAYFYHIYWEANEVLTLPFGPGSPYSFSDKTDKPTKFKVTVMSENLIALGDVVYSEADKLNDWKSYANDFRLTSKFLPFEAGWLTNNERGLSLKGSENLGPHDLYITFNYYDGSNKEVRWSNQEWGPASTWVDYRSADFTQNPKSHSVRIRFKDVPHEMAFEPIFR